MNMEKTTLLTDYYRGTENECLPSPLTGLHFPPPHTHTDTNVSYKGFSTKTNILGSVLLCSIKEAGKCWQGEIEIQASSEVRKEGCEGLGIKKAMQDPKHL